MNNDSNLFIVNTFYHIFLAILLTKGKSFSKKQNTLLIIPSFKRASLIVKLLQTWTANPFHQIELISQEFGFRTDLWHEFLIKSRIKKGLSKFMAMQRFDHVFIFNDYSKFNQYALTQAHQHNGSLKCTLVEDGTGAYNTYFFNVSTRLTNLLKEIFYGQRLTDIAVMGTSDFSDDFFAIFPDYVRAELKTKNVSEIPKINMDNVTFTDELFEIYQITVLRSAELRQIQGLLLLENSKLYPRYPALTEILYDILEIFKARNLNIIAKNHPREKQKNYWHIDSIPNIHMIPQEIPLEFLLLQKDFHPHFILGGISTFLMAAKWLFPNIKCVSYAKMFDFQDDHLLKTFKKVNIRLLENKRELQEFLSDN